VSADEDALRSQPEGVHLRQVPDEPDWQGTTTVDGALWYASALGWPVVPVHSVMNGRCSCGNADCRSEGKHPRTAHGKDDATTDLTVIRNWFDRWPTANVGIRTGPPGPEVTDVDNLDNWFELLDGRDVPETRIALTGRGAHLYFEASGLPTSTSKLAPGIDTKGADQLVVAPPSVHRSGRRYQWISDGAQLAPVPEWILVALSSPRAKHGSSLGVPTPAWGSAGIARELDRLRAATEGTRNHTLFSVSATVWELVNGGHVREEAASRAIFEAAEQIGLSITEIENTWRSAQRHVAGNSRYPQNPRPPVAPMSAPVQSLAEVAGDLTPEDEWGEPQPFLPTTKPDFPSSSLPGWVERYVSAVAEETQTPVDLPGALALASMAAVLAKRATIIQPWREPLNLYTLVVLPPGERKSSVFRQMTAPLEELEALLVERTASARALAQAQHKLAEDSVKRARRTASNEDTDEARQGLIDAELALAELKPHGVPRLIANDTTPEALVLLLAENDGRIALLDDEGGIFGIMAGRYTGGMANLDVFLKGHDGGNYRRDRVGTDKPPVTVREPALTLGLTVQPAVLESLAENSLFRGRGLIARFLYSIPTSSLGYRKIDPDRVTADVLNEYHARLVALEEVPQGMSLVLSPEAKHLFNEFRERHEQRLRPFGDLRPCADWASKLPGALLRISGLLHLARSEPRQTSGEISMSAIRDALAFSDYFIAHAREALFLMDADETLALARHCIEWLDEKNLTEVTVRDLYRALHAGAQAASDALDVLVDRALVRIESRPAAGGHGGRPSQVVVVSPRYRAQNANTRA
jgi:hypothetical protein